jgi:hypothetical protein
MASPAARPRTEFAVAGSGSNDGACSNTVNVSSSSGSDEAVVPAVPTSSLPVLRPKRAESLAEPHGAEIHTQTNALL